MQAGREADVINLDSGEEEEAPETSDGTSKSPKLARCYCSLFYYF
jgi:hypothetical protein